MLHSLRLPRRGTRSLRRASTKTPSACASSPFAIVFDSNGVEVRIQKVEKASPPPGTVLGWRVRNLQQTMTDLAKAGVSFERYSFLESDERGIWTSPDGAQVAWFKDPDGNTLSLTQAPD